MLLKVWQVLLAAYETISRRIVVVPLILVFTTVCLCASAFSVRTYVITDGASTVEYTSYEKEPTRAVMASGRILSEYDEVLTSVNENGSVSVCIMRAGEVGVTADGVTHKIPVSYNDTVADAVARAGVTIGEEDEVIPSINSTVQYGSSISVSRITYEEVTRTVIVPYQNVVQKNSDVMLGVTNVIQQGVSGRKEQTVKVKKSNGIAVAEEVLSETVLVQPTNKIVEKGTKVVANVTGGAGSLPVSRDGALRYSKVIDVVATAYCPCYQCSGGWGHQTASGARARVGLIAVDPRVIPLGTRLYITSKDGTSWSYGYAVAADTGGAIKGNRIDLFFNTHSECLNFGRRGAKVYVLE